MFENAISDSFGTGRSRKWKRIPHSELRMAACPLLKRTQAAATASNASGRLERRDRKSERSRRFCANAEWLSEPLSLRDSRDRPRIHPDHMALHHTPPTVHEYRTAGHAHGTEGRRQMRLSERPRSSEEMDGRSTMTFQCGMPIDRCLNTLKPGEHETHADAMKCVRQGEPKKLKAFRQQ